MANLFTNKKLPKRIAVIYKDLGNVTSKLHRTAGSIGFIKKALYHEVIPKFARVNGNFINKNEQYKSERSVLCSYLNEHVHTSKSLVSKHVLKDKLKQVTGQLLYISIINYIHKVQYHERINSIKSKSYKLKRLIREKTPPSKFKAPIVNLSSYDMSELERKQLHLGLEYSFVDKPKHLKKSIAANFEIVSHRVSESINHDKLEDFY